MSTALKLLFITDIHLSFQNKQKLSEWQRKNQIKFDLILIGGDVANCDQNKKTHNQKQQHEQAHKILSEIQQIFGCRMHFIPGNHDPLQYYQKSYNLNQHIHSVHEHTLQIADGLELIGFGGSVPGYLDKEDTQQLWEGYPFSTNEALSVYCEYNQIFSSLKNKQKQKIILTHCGPYNSQTSIDRRNQEKPIYAGARYFNSLVEYQNILVYLHGHVHLGSRFAKVNSISIINPGPLHTGQFGYIFLEKNLLSDKWKIQSTTFVQL